MNTRLTTICALLLASNASFAQEPVARPGQPIGGIVVKGGKNPGGSMLFSISGGIMEPGTATKENANVSNGTAFNGNLYVPVILKAPITIGFNTGVEYFSSNKGYNTEKYPPYGISGQTGTPNISAKGAGSPKAQGFKTEAGAQANFSFGGITLSPILNAGYFSLKQKAFAITQTGSVNGQNYSYDLYTQSETKTKGFVFIPKLRVAYFPGKLGFYLEGNYTAGPTLSNETTTFKPQGSALKDGNYSIDQMIQGRNVTQNNRTSYKSFGVNFGVSFAFFSKKGYDHYKAHSDMASARTDNPLYKGSGQAGNNPIYQGLVAGNPIGGIIVKGGKNPGGNLRTITTNEKGEFELKGLEAGNYKFTATASGNAIVDNPLYDEPGNSGVNVLHDALRVAGNPIGGIIVKGGKNPGGSSMTVTSNEKGEFELKGLKAGDYKFIITAPEQPTGRGKLRGKVTKPGDNGM